MTKRIFLAFLLFVGAPAHAAEPIKIGVLTTGSTSPEWSQPNINGINLAVKEINAKGGIAGHPVEIITRETKASPTEGVRVAQELVERDDVLLLTGEEFGNVTAAVSSYAKHAKVPFVASGGASADITGKDGHPYIFVMEPTATMQGTLVARATKDMKVKKWVTIAPNFNYGQSLSAAFKAEVKKNDPKTEFAKDIWFEDTKLNGADIVQAVKGSKADGVYFVIFGQDLVNYYRAAKTRGLLNETTHVGAILGLPEQATLLGKEYPAGWLTGGFPGDQIKTPEYEHFAKAYTQEFHDFIKWPSIYGYMNMYLIKKAIESAGTNREKIAAALKKVTIDGPIGPIRFQKNGRSTQGFWVGKTGFVNGAPSLVDWTYHPADELEKGKLE